MSRPANRITVSHSRRGTTIKASGSAARALFEAMTGERIGGAPAKPVPLTVVPFQGACTVHFEDHGQDFLEWDLDDMGFVVGCRPHQAFAWLGVQVCGEPQPGCRLQIVRSEEEAASSVNYPVAKVVRRVSLAVKTGGTGDGD